jgi:hypothetical protein
MLMPAWIETLRIALTFSACAVLPVQLWAMWQSYQQYKKWEREEQACFGRWKAEMDKLARDQAEVDRLRAQLTIGLTAR